MQFLVSHLYILLTVTFAVTSQMIIKWQMKYYSFENYPTIIEKFYFASKLLINPYILLSIFLTLLSGLSWMIAMTKFDISYAYPYTSLGFVLILICSHYLFGEVLSVYKIIGVLCIVLGILILSRDL